MRRRHLLLTAMVAAGALICEPAAAAAWRMPVEGEVVRAFDYSRAAPFERGAHRNIQIAGSRGDEVRSACGGLVSFAGRLPGGEQGVSVRCGSLAATHTGLGSIEVRAGRRIAAGALIGTLAGDRLTLAARRIADRWGYVDPLRLIAAGPPALGPAPPPRRPARPADPLSRPAPRPLGRPASSPASHEAPIAAWIALASATIALGGAPIAVSSVRRRWAGPSTSRRRSTT